MHPRQLAPLIRTCPNSGANRGNSDLPLSYQRLPRLGHPTAPVAGNSF